MRVTKQQYEAQLQQIFRLLLENKTQEHIAEELGISSRTVNRYAIELDKRYGEAQRQKTNDTLFMEAQLFKNRMLSLFRALERVVITHDRNVSAGEKAKCAEVAANIAIDVLKMESEGVHKLREVAEYDNNKGNKLYEDIRSRSTYYSNSNNRGSSRDNVVPGIVDDPEETC